MRMRQEAREDGLNLCALSTGTPALHPDIDDAWYVRVAADDGHLAVLRRLAFRSMISVPMRYRGKILGTVYVDSRREGVPFSEQDLRYMEAFANLAATALEQARLSEKLASENVYLRQEAQERHSYQNLIGKNVKMQAVYDMMERVAASHLPVLIQGESGTGKELVARALHYASPRRQRKFLSENVAAIPDTLLESEMFGHVRGAFTGADRDRQGLFEQADGGTLFLDEIGDMSLPMQAKLLRALQEGEIRPVGGKESRKVNVRIISATNKDLDRMLKEQRFREDLYWRLNVYASRCRRCASARRTFPCWWITSWPRRPARQASRRAAWRWGRCSCCCATPGRATCASWKTRSSGWRCWRRATSSRSATSSRAATCTTRSPASTRRTRLPPWTRSSASRLSGRWWKRPGTGRGRRSFWESAGPRFSESCASTTSHTEN